MDSSGEITRLIAEWQQGDRGAEQALFETLYDSLHRIAVQCLQRERAEQTLSATALVHEAYLRFIRSQRFVVSDRNHFLALSARVMHRVMVDKARQRRSNKRGGALTRVDEGEAMVSDAQADQIIAVDTALAELRRYSPRQSELVVLRWFAGYTLEESADILGISARTARREWQVARVRLRGAINGAAPAS